MREVSVDCLAESGGFSEETSNRSGGKLAHSASVARSQFLLCYFILTVSPFWVDKEGKKAVVKTSNRN